MFTNYAVSHTLRQFLRDSGYHVSGPTIQLYCNNITNIRLATTDNPPHHIIATIYVYHTTSITSISLIVYDQVVKGGSATYSIDLTDPNSFDEILQLLSQATCANDIPLRH